MLSAILLVTADPATTTAPAVVRDVARTLSNLVGLVVDDIIADACVVARPGFGLAMIEENAGCAVIEDDNFERAFTAAVSNARRDAIFVLVAGYAPGPGFADEVATALEQGRARMLRLEPTSFLERLVPGMTQAVGVIASRASILSRQPKPRTVRALAGALAARQLRTVAQRI